MLQLPAPESASFPPNTRAGRARFWLAYWFWFASLLPWMLLRQLAVSLYDSCSAFGTWNRRFAFAGDTLSLIFMNNLRSLAVTTIFGERFAAIQYYDVLIDPGPSFGSARLERHLGAAGKVEAIVATHSHEEHIGNTLLAQRITGARVYGTDITLDAVADPEQLSIARRLFIGQPSKADSQHLERLGPTLRTPLVELDVIESPGHCAGHASLFDRTRGLLFAGDSFLHEVFTCPNKDVSGDDWIATLERYAELPIRTMIGTHGDIFSTDAAFARRPFVVQGRSPSSLIQDKLTFLRWARAVVAEGERRRLPYSVIEAVLFPWTRWWAWATWFRDEGSRLFSAGEFSRTHFVRSLSRTPERVPPRFPPFARLARWLRGSRSSQVPRVRQG